MSLALNKLSISLILSALLLGACGGGGSETTPPPVTVTPPVVVTNSAPVISGVAGKAQENLAYSFIPTISDPDGDSLTLTISNKPEWVEFNTTTGELSGTPGASDIGTLENVTISVSDNKVSSELAFNLEVEFNPLEEALRTGKVSLIETELTLLDAALESIEDNKTKFDAAKSQIFSLAANGSVNANSLSDVSWNPTHDAAVLGTSFGFNDTLFLTNSVSNSNYSVQALNLGLIGETEKSRYVFLGSNPMRNYQRNTESLNTQMHSVLENIFAWLTKKDDLAVNGINVVTAQLAQNFYFPDQTAVRNWLNEFYPENVKVNDATSCNGVNLSNCISVETDVLIISQVLFEGDDQAEVIKGLQKALDLGVPVLYMHYDGGFTDLGKAIFPMFNVSYKGDNYWRRLQIQAFDGSSIFGKLPTEITAQRDLLNFFKNDNFTADLSLCENNSCPEAHTYYTEFTPGAASIRDEFRNLDASKINIFNKVDADNYRYQKLIILLADKFRENVVYPMDRATTATSTFLKSLFADYTIYNSRLEAPAQLDMGNFSRSDFSHITAGNKTLVMTSKSNFRSTGAYALPGQTFSITRNDSSEVVTKVFVNTLRSGATHLFDENAYSRPKFLKTVEVEVKPNETVSLTSVYGGPIQISFDTNDLPVEFTLQNIGQHPYWQSTADDTSFAAALDKGDYDWAEIATPSFEIHSRMDKMLGSVEEWGSAAALAENTQNYLHNYPHVLAGFQGPGIDVVPEIHNFANANGLEIQTLDKVKHMNADQATCGYGCSGNPYDAYWSYSPLGHGDLHELGHGLEKGRMRFAGWVVHATTNPYSYYTKTQYFKETGVISECQNIPFKGIFDTVQASISQPDPVQYMQDANLTAWNQSVAIILQVMMSAQAEGKLVDGWNYLPRLHIVEREFSTAVKNESNWNAKREGLGFAGISRAQANAMNNNDWMLIAMSHVLQMDMRDYLTMWGLTHSTEAADHVAARSLEVMPRKFYVSDGRDFCQGLDKTAIAIDGVSAYPL